MFRVSVLFVVAFPILSAAFGPSNNWMPSPNPAAVVDCSNTTRLVVMTPRVVRLQQRKATTPYDDRPSTTFVNRHTPVPSFHTALSDAWCNITTSSMTVTYSLTSGVFAASGVLTGTSQWEWMQGDTDPENLNGTRLDLSGCCHSPNDPQYPLEDGMLSRSGWRLVNETATQRLDDTDPAWPSGFLSPSNSTDALDATLFGCGLDFKACLQDYVAVAGNMTLPPASALGVWWSRHWGGPYAGQPFGSMTGDRLVQEVLDGYRDNALPLNQMVTDMEWHSMLSDTDCKTFIGIKGWGGFTWNSSLFPDPAGFIAKVHTFDVVPLPDASLPVPSNRTIRLLVNLHPSRGVDRCQTAYPALVKALGLPAAYNETITVDYTNKTVMNAYFPIVVRAIGTDYVWLDTRPVALTTNALYVDDMATRNLRPMVLSRWGGLGDHRNPIGFSGDSLRLWTTLQYEIGFTSTAANVAFGWWSHDIGGFSIVNSSNPYPGEAPELELRWLQFAAHGAVLRQHCRYCDQRVWTLPEPFFSLAAGALHTRNAHVPYIYTQGWLGSLNGLSVVRPLYHEWPTQGDAYVFHQQFQYIFGNDMVVRPVVDPVDPTTNTTAVTLWVPPGTWWSTVTREVLTGPASHTLAAGLGDVPTMVRVGSVVPTKDVNGTAFVVAPTLRWTVYADPSLGVVSGTGMVYEDAGDTQAYLHGSFVTTTASVATTAATLTVTVQAADAHNADFFFPMQRDTVVQLPMWKEALPSLVTVDGGKLPASAVSFDAQGVLVIALGDVSTTKDVVVVVHV